MDLTVRVNWDWKKPSLVLLLVAAEGLQHRRGLVHQEEEAGRIGSTDLGSVGHSTLARLSRIVETRDDRSEASDCLERGTSSNFRVHRLTVPRRRTTGNDFSM